jgi:hypothetical protein
MRKDVVEGAVVRCVSIFGRCARGDEANSVAVAAADV